MQNIRTNNTTLLELLPKQILGNLFNDYSKNIKLAYQDNGDIYLLGKNSFNVKINISQIAECFINKANGITERLEKPNIFQKITHKEDYQSYQLPTFNSQKSLLDSE